MVETSQFMLDELTEEELKARVVLLSKELKTYTKDTLINRWEAGKRITDKQVEYLKNKGKIDVTELKTIMVNVPVVDLETEKFMGFKKVPKSFNKSQLRLDAAIAANVLVDEASVMSNNLRLEENITDLEVKNETIGRQRAELAAAKAVVHARETTRIAREMEVKNLQYLSRKEIYEKAVRDNKLTSKDMTSHALEIIV